MSEYTERDKVMCSQLDSGQWQWWFMVWDVDANEYKQVVTGVTHTEGMALCQAHAQAGWYWTVHFKMPAAYA